MKKTKIYISLTGGLGNQLFQLAAGLNLANGEDLYLNAAFGKPRKNSRGEPELLSFTLPDNVSFAISNNAPWFISKIAGYLLRVGVAPRGIEKYQIASRLIVVICSVPLSIFLKQRVSITYSKNLGYSPIIIENKRNLLFGYFQTFYWVEDPIIRKAMKNLSLKFESHELESFKELAEIEKPIIVHVRLGDYVLEKNFGTLSEDYYEESIDKIIQSGKCKSIWLFSDEMEKAKKLLPDNMGIPIRFVEQVDNSASVTFEIMRLGYGYVIANSTFSWWAAYLARNPDVEIIAPKPWFKDMHEPRDLIPKNWQRITGNIFINNR
jgi:hypothetical protein